MPDDNTPAEGNEPEAKKDGQTPDDAAVLAAADNPDAVKAALQRERQAAKEARERAEAAEAKVQENEDAKKSEKEKLEGKATEAERKANEAGAKALRYEVAADKDLPLKWASRLRGETKEQLEADADELVKELNPGAADLGGGQRGSSATDESMDDRIRRAAGRR